MTQINVEATLKMFQDTHQFVDMSRSVWTIVRFRSNVVEACCFEERLEQMLRRYQNQSLEAAQIIAEVITLVKEIRAARNCGKRLGLNDEELAFYDALLTNANAQQVLTNEKLCSIAQELVRIVRQNIIIDWNTCESARAKMRTVIKRLLRKHGYPPNPEAKEVGMLLEQMENLSKLQDRNHNMSCSITISHQIRAYLIIVMKLETQTHGDGSVAD